MVPSEVLQVGVDVGKTLAGHCQGQVGGEALEPWCHCQGCGDTFAECQ